MRGFHARTQRKMKNLLIIFALGVLTEASVFDKPETRKFAEDCASVHKVDLSVFVPGQKPDPKIFEQLVYRCFARCMYRRFDAFTKEDECVPDKFMEIFEFTDKPKMDTCMKTCVSENKQDDKCDKVFGTKTCLITCMRA